MVGDKINELRQSLGLTQEELAEKLCVTEKEVFCWENNENEPSLDIISKMAKVFNVPINNFFDEEIAGVVELKEVKNNEYKKKKEKSNKESADKLKRKKTSKTTLSGIERRKKSFIWGGIFTALIVVAVFIITIMVAPISVALMAGAVSLLFFPFISCLYLDNNFILDMIETVASWSIRLPGLIFELSLDGLVWLLTVKLLFWILGGIASIFCFVFAIVLGLVVSLFVYPFALAKNIKHPESLDI